jgi:hypothetical protein
MDRPFCHWENLRAVSPFGFSAVQGTSVSNHSPYNKRLSMLFFFFFFFFFFIW